jgi:hypothetical protein
MDFAAANRCRYDPASTAGHYESYFQRANHGERPLAFWVRYTLFQPKGNTEPTLGEIWAVYFDGEHAAVHVAREAFPLAACRIDGAGALRIGHSTLSQRQLHGQASGNGATLRWSLDASGDSPPMLVLPAALYETRLPAAKLLVTLPNARFRGQFQVGDEVIDIDGWQGSLNHNWGRRHTDAYAWGQVAGFPGAPEVFLECATARLRLGPCWSPAMTVLVMRVDGKEWRLNGVLQTLRNDGHYHGTHWTITAQAPGVRIDVTIEAAPSIFATLRYENPPGGVKTCLNTKLASCTVLLQRAGRNDLRLHTAHGAAFEMLSG